MSEPCRAERFDPGSAHARGGADPYPYPDDVRTEMLRFVPRGIERLLDVGCGWGGFGHAVKTRDPAVEVWGVEVSATACESARDRVDRVVHGPFPDALGSDAPHFDCVVFNDVLEHLVDPWHALERTRDLLAPGGVVVASIPNVRDLRVVAPLVLLGRWQYTDTGLLDRTHLRFFTLSSVVDLFRSAGYSVESVDGVNLGLATRVPRASLLAERLLGPGLNSFRTPQYAVVARARPA
ncbi:MAG: class I SAM-dependent methyltransferase [Actinomycetota bacterium]|nr:class I SAM-dependent methyltransferase [Actinomycetota bacterium]